MALRKPATRRPEGTDGSDFSYRMVVVQRYQKVAELKSRLCKLLVAQTIIQVLGVGKLLLLGSRKNRPDNFAILSTAIGLISLLIGELGRRRTQRTLLRLYSAASSMATALSVACVIRSDFFLQAINDQTAAQIKFNEWFEIAFAFSGILLQIIVIITTTSLLQNMSPKRTSR
ncbi:jagunal-like protein [Wolffia australiana]